MSVEEQPKESRGGKREGAGRKPAPYETKTFAFRTRVKWIKPVKKAIKAKIKELEQKDKSKEKEYKKTLKKVCINQK